MKYAIALALIAGGMALTYDGCTYGLAPADPVSGREKGCYTAIERWVGVERESWIRPCEQFGAAAALVLAMVVLFRRSKRSTTGAAAQEHGP